MRNKYPFVAFVILQMLTLIAIFPNYIPSWEERIFVAHLIAAVVSVILLLVLISGMFKTRNAAGVVGTTILSGLIILPYIALQFIAFVFFHNDGFSDATLRNEVQMRNQTFYIYEDDWKDPGTTITVQKGSLPFEKKIGTLMPCFTEDLGIKEVDNTVVFYCGKNKISYP